MPPQKPYFNIGQKLHFWIEITVFIWLPIYALFRLTREAIEKFEAGKK
ncbi:MAG: hypothetical protein KAT32_03345 [Candidatus Moranbacteria bacterium]|nr:hypothetical protein [Candidatus Moranbacteria bacterium]